jgi:hypothetical protein
MTATGIKGYTSTMHKKLSMAEKDLMHTSKEGSYDSKRAFPQAVPV